MNFNKKMKEAEHKEKFMNVKLDQIEEADEESESGSPKKSS